MNAKPNKKAYNILKYFIAGVWLVNGLLCKVFNLVPRHKEIVAGILDSEYAGTLTVLIGISEVLMAIWIITEYKSKLNALIQVIIIAVMNILEFILVPEMLLWGKFNSLFAFIFILIISFNEFYFNKNQLN